MGDNTNVKLPPGFRFEPTDEELLHFLHRKSNSLSSSHTSDVIPDLHLYPYDPWQLNGKALAEGNQWYFYSRRIQKRVTQNGYWKPIGMDEPINSSATNKKLGVKKYYMFHLADHQDTNWFMQEYCLLDSPSTTRSSSSKRRSGDNGKWVVCRVYERDEDNETELSCLDEVFLSLDDLDEISLPN